MLIAGIRCQVIELAGALNDYVFKDKYIPKFQYYEEVVIRSNDE